MYKTALFSFLLLCLTASASIAGPKADIRQLEQESNAAYAANEFDKYFSFYSDEAILWFPEGRTDIPSYKKEWGEFLKSGGGIKAGTTSDMHVTLSPRGDVAIASYLLRLTTQDADKGKKVHTEDYQESDVWFKTDAGWKIMHVHYSQVPKSTKP